MALLTIMTDDIIDCLRSSFRGSFVVALINMKGVPKSNKDFFQARLVMQKWSLLKQVFFSDNYRTLK